MMSDKEIFEKIKPFFNGCNRTQCKANVVSPEQELLTELDMDSLDVVDVILLCEHEFDFKMPDDELNNLKTVNNIIESIKKHGRFE